MPIPKKKFLFIRHAQTDANINGIMAGGGTDIPLNDTGLKQADSVGQNISPEKLKITKVYCSPMIRTQQTAEKVLQNYDLKPELVEGLREWQAGDWEGVPFHELPLPGTTEFQPPQGETREDFQKRVVDAMNYILEKNDDMALVVAHGGVWHELEKALGIKDSGIIENAHLIEVDCYDSGWTYKEVVSVEVRDALL